MRYQDDDEDEPDVECNKCGKAGLHWEHMGAVTYRLYDSNGKLHRCDQARLDKRAAKDFEDLDK